MKNVGDFLVLVLDSISEHIAVINEEGVIVFVNKSWSSFGDQNGCSGTEQWEGINYIDICDKSSSTEGSSGAQAANGIRSVIEKKNDAFYFEYPCHSPDELRWFMMRVTRFSFMDENYFVIAHQNITERKLAEDTARDLARIDSLTKIPNRRSFDEFLHIEWRRCLRLKKPICLALIDLDHFKILNDTYGHQYGDECLVKIGLILKQFGNRPGDICARYGGEEFAIILGDTGLKEAQNLLNDLLKGISELKIKNKNSPTEKTLTASAGLIEISPSPDNNENLFISQADNMLYKAKNNGRNRMEFRASI